MRITILALGLLLISLSSCNNTPKEVNQTSSETEDFGFFGDTTKLLKLSTGYSFTEGPATDASGNVYFTDQPNDRIYKWDVETNAVALFSDSTHRANGLYVNENNQLLACADKFGELIRFSEDGNTFEVLTKDFKNNRFNGPNDLWINSNGDLFFTDPNYKRPYWKSKNKQGFIAHMSLYYLAKDASEAILIDSNFVKPNGIIGNQKLQKLYVADAEAGKTYSYDLDTLGRASNRKLFCNMGSDGMTLDEEGNLYLTGNGVTVFNSKGEKIGHLSIPENWTANVTFGGSSGKILFITASTSVYTLKMPFYNI